MANKTTLSLKDPTPAWVNWIFRVQFVINKALLLLLSSSTHVEPKDVKEYLLYLAVIDLTVWGIGRFVGQKKEDYEN